MSSINHKSNSPANAKGLPEKTSASTNTSNMSIKGENVHEVSEKRAQLPPVGHGETGHEIWQRLQLSQSIRWIILLAGTGDAALKCRLVEVALEEARNKYTALSYAWETLALTEPIICNGHETKITRTLFSALHRLRDPTKNKRFWCDGLCIDQGNTLEALQERASQVRMMDRIFSGAFNVVIDLGADDGTFPEVLRGLNAVLQTNLNLLQRSADRPDLLTVLGLPDFSHTMWSAYRKLLLRPWFRRVWCVQEAVLAREIRVLFGNYSVSFEQLAFVVLVVTHIHHLEARRNQTSTWDAYAWRGFGMSAGCFHAVYQRRQARANKNPPSLCELVMSTLGHKSTDPRDRLYALYGMVDPQVIDALPVDYSETYTSCAIRLSEYLIRVGCVTWTLVLGGGISLDRPSWSIHLDSWNGKHKFDSLAATISSTGQSATYAAGGAIIPRTKAISADQCLGIHGVIFDEVMFLTEVCPMSIEDLDGVPESSSTKLEDIIAFITWIDMVVQWAKQHTCDDEMVWRTLIADFNSHEDSQDRKTNGRALPGYGACFRRLIEYIEGLKAIDPPIDPKTIQDEELKKLLVPPGAVEYWMSMTSAIVDRRIAGMDSSTLALVPRTCSTGDKVAVFQGVPVPFVLRADGEGKYFVVGYCYVHGAMDGEVLQRGHRMQDILLR